MKPETLSLYNKYRVFLHVLSDERLQLFQKSENSLDYEAFFEYYNDVINWHWKIKPVYKNYKNRRSQIIKKFEYKKYEILLRPIFCTDIKNLILSFIFKN